MRPLLAVALRPRGIRYSPIFSGVFFAMADADGEIGKSNRDSSLFIQEKLEIYSIYGFVPCPLAL